MDYRFYSVRVLELDAAERRVRFRVLLVHYERSWGLEGLLPDDAGFFFGVLWEAADGVAKRRSGPLNEAVSVDDRLDATWVAANAHRFVVRAERLAARNLPVSDADAGDLADFHVDHYDSLADHFHEWDDPWAHEGRLVQADYDVWVTDPRWLAPLESGQGWCTDAFSASSGRESTGGGGPAAAAGRAYLGLGWIRERRDLDGATAAYQRAAETGDAHIRAKALVALDGIQARREGRVDDPSDSYARMAREYRAALELCVRLQAEGREEEARAAFLLIIEAGEPALLAEARRRAGMVTPAEHGHRLAQQGDRGAAAAELRRAYEPSSAVVDLALAVYAGDFEAARGMSFGGDLEATWAAQVAVDLAFHHAREGNDDTVDALVELAGQTDSAGAAWDYALGNGSAYPLETVVEVGRKLVEWIPPSDYDLVGSEALTGAREAFWRSVRELGGTEPAARAVLKLAQLLADLGETVAARAACVCVTELGGAEAADWAWLELAWLHTETGDDEAAEEAYETVADTREQAPAAIAKAALESAERPGMAEHRAYGSSGDADAAYYYALWLAARKGKAHLRELMLKIAADTGKGAARAALALGVDAHRAGDDDTARDWLLRASESDDPKIAHQSADELGLLAKKRRDLPEALRWFAPIADSDHLDAPLAAAHIGELCYWLDDRDEAVRWYRRTLDGTDDPELVGEAAYRTGEVLSGRGEAGAARALLRRAVESGDATFAPKAADLLNTLGPDQSMGRSSSGVS